MTTTKAPETTTTTEAIESTGEGEEEDEETTTTTTKAPKTTRTTRAPTTRQFEFVYVINSTKVIEPENGIQLDLYCSEKIIDNNVSADKKLNVKTDYFI